MIARNAVTQAAKRLGRPYIEAVVVYEEGILRLPAQLIKHIPVSRWLRLAPGNAVGKKDFHKILPPRRNMGFYNHEVQVVRIA